jgi:DNA polymerase III alpha subunit (gram-positive type)
MPKFGDKNLAMVDIETTGLSIKDHEIIEIGALIYNEKEDRVLDEWEVKIAPRHIETASQQALKINGYMNNPNLYRTSIKSALIKFNNLVEGCIIVGQNIAEFDLPFIYRDMSEFNISPSWHRRDKLELGSLMWNTIKDIDMPGLSLANFCDFFKISNEGSHTALVDCRRTYEVYRRIK